MTTPARQSPEYYEQTREKFVAWLAMTAAERRALDLPPTKAEFARLFDVSDRVLRKWAGETSDEVEALKVKKVVQSGGTVGPRRDDFESMTNAELLAEIIRTNLLSAARGDDSAMNFLRANQQVLKPLIDALNEDFSSDFEAATDDELVAKFLDTFEAECVLVLRGRGWTVEKA